jgi:hypothetical protein
MLEASGRVRGARVIASAALGITLVTSLPWLGWVLLLCLHICALQLSRLEPRMARSSHPERTVAFSLAFTAVTIAAGVPFTGGSDSSLLV